MEKDLKITKIEAYRVHNKGIQDAYYRAHPPYWRIQDRGVIYWLTCVDTIDEHRAIYDKPLWTRLEQGFKDHYGVMHEQLSLF